MNETPGTDHDARPTVLLVEDNPDLRSATRDLLATLGYEVVTTRTGAGALASAGRKRFGLVLVNAYPTDGRGLDLVDELRAVQPELPALLVSGFGDDLELRRRVLEGQVGFLPIPFSLESLEAKINEALEQNPTAAPSAPAARVAAITRTPQAVVATRGVAGSRAPRAWLAAAVVVLAAGVAFQLGGQFAGGAPEMPAPELGQALRGHEIELVEPVGEIGRLPDRFVWRAAPDALLYRLVVTRIDDTVVWEAETEDTSIAVPRHITDQLHAAVSYVWRVEGLAEDFSAVGRSALVAFRSGAAGPA